VHHHLQAGQVEGLSLLLGELIVVACCASAAEALQQLDEARPDVVLLDLLMHEMDGAAAAAAILAGLPTRYRTAARPA
jgi:CheY-like chemotaxis protein